MPALLNYTAGELQELQDWFATESQDLFRAKTRCDIEEDRVRLHVAAQAAHRLAADIGRFAAAHQTLRDDGLIED